MSKRRTKSILALRASNVDIHRCLVRYFVLLLSCSVLANCDKSIQNEIDSGNQMHTKNSFTELSGGRIVGEKWLKTIESPYSLHTDLVIERSGRLIIEPGVKVHVAPMVGITVRGVLNALVGLNSIKLISYAMCSLSLTFIELNLEFIASFDVK